MNAAGPLHLRDQSSGIGFVLFVHQAAELYGSDKVLLNLVGEYCKSGIQCLVLLPGPGPLVKELEKAGAEVKVCEVLKVSRALFSLKGLLSLTVKIPLAMAGMRQALQGRKPDVIHSNTMAVLAGALYSRLFRIPHVWHIHELLTKPKVVVYAFPRLIWALSDRVGFISQQTLDAMVSVFPRLKPISSVIHNGMDLSAIEQASAQTTSFRQESGIADSALLVGLVGRINAWKGQKLLVDAVAWLRQQGSLDPQLRVVFVGSPPPGQEFYLDELHAHIQAKGVADIVSVAPFTENIHAVWRSLDIAVVPSTEPEPFGLVALEAMAHRKPVIAAAHGGLLDIFADGQSGVLFTPCDEQALGRALQQLSASPSTRQQLGEKGHERLRSHFSLEAQAAGFLAVYRAVQR
jgi:glycosyltransferase involved in cell wall biosynthesis